MIRKKMESINLGLYAVLCKKQKIRIIKPFNLLSLRKTMKLNTLILASILTMTASMQAMEKLRGYNGRMKEDYEDKKVRRAGQYNQKAWRTFNDDGISYSAYTTKDVSSVKIEMQLVDDGSMQPATSQETTGLLTLIGYIACCWSCIIISQTCCPNPPN